MIQIRPCFELMSDKEKDEWSRYLMKEIKMARRMHNAIIILTIIGVIAIIALFTITK